MMLLSRIYVQMSKALDLVFLAKFIVVFFLLYYLDLAYLGVTNNGGSIYFPFLAQYFNYTEILIKSMLTLSNGLAHVAGLDTVLLPGNILRVINGSAVWMARPCVGLVMVFFWMSFVISHKAGWKSKLKWSVLGALFIFLVNSVRVTMILLAHQNKWRAYEQLDQHALFNYICYAIIVCMIILFNKYEVKKAQQ